MDCAITCFRPKQRSSLRSISEPFIGLWVKKGHWNKSAHALILDRSDRSSIQICCCAQDSIWSIARAQERISRCPHAFAPFLGQVVDSDLLLCPRFNSEDADCSYELFSYRDQRMIDCCRPKCTKHSNFFDSRNKSVQQEWHFFLKRADRCSSRL